MKLEDNHEPVVRRFALAQIHPDKNAREEFDAEKLAELADSLKDTKGVLQPLLGVLREDGGVDLIAGERRWRASKLAGLPDVEVKLVQRPSRKDHLKWNLVENLQRENLKPLEKAKRIQQMLELVDESSGLPIYNRASLALELGISDSSIGRHEALLKASTKIQKAVNDEGLDIEIGSLIGALPASLRDRAEKEIVFRNWGGPMKREEAIKHAATYRRDLRKAQFDKKDAELVPDAGPCEACPFFGLNREDVEGKVRGYTCLNPECFDKKQQAHVNRVAAMAEREGTKVLGQTNTDRVFQSWNNQVNPSSGYVDLKDEPDAYLLKDGKGKAPKWDKLLDGSGVPVVVAFDHEGRVRRLVETKLAVEAAKRGDHAEKFKPKAGEDLETSDDKKHAAQISRAKNKASAAALLEGCCALLEAFSGQRWTREVRVAFLEEICNSGGHTRDDLELLCRILQPDLKSVPNPHEKLAELVELRLPTDTGLDAFILIARNIRHIRYQGFHHIAQSANMQAYCEWAEFDAKKWKDTCAQREKDAEREVKAAIRAKEKPVKKGPAKSDKAADEIAKGKVGHPVRCFAAADAVGMVQAMTTVLVQPSKPNENGVFNTSQDFKMTVGKRTSFTIRIAARKMEKGDDFDVGFCTGYAFECGEALRGSGAPKDSPVHGILSAALLDEAEDLRRALKGHSSKAAADAREAINEVIRLLKVQAAKDRAAWNAEHNPPDDSDGPVMTAAKRGIVSGTPGPEWMEAFEPEKKLGRGPRGKSDNAKDYAAAAAKKRQPAKVVKGMKELVEDWQSKADDPKTKPVWEDWSIGDWLENAKEVASGRKKITDFIGQTPDKTTPEFIGWTAARVKLYKLAKKGKGAK